MREFFTFKRAALLLLMSLAAWCLPASGQEGNNGYYLSGLTGEDYLDFLCSGISSTCHLEKPEGAPDNVYILFQLEGGISTDEFQLIVNGQTSDAEGKLWITPDMWTDNHFEYTLEHKLGPQYVGKTYAYTLTLYASQSTDADPLAVFSGSRTVKRTVRLNTSPNRIAGDMSTNIPFTITVEAYDFAGTPNTMLMIRKKDGVSITSTSLEPLSGTNLSQSNSYDYFRIGELQDATYNFTLLCTQEFHDIIEMRIVDGDEQTIPYNLWVNVSVPFNVSETDIAGLTKIATDNNNAYLHDYISNKGYLNSENDSIRVEWDDSVSPARIRNLNFLFRSLTTLDVSAFDSLEYLTVNQAAITALDLSMLKKLRRVGLYGTSITSLNQVKLPDNPELQVYGSCEIAVGEQIDRYNYQLVSGNTVDLSGYAAIDGEPTTIKWFKGTDSGEVEVTAEWKQTSSYVFVVPAPTEADAGKQVRYWCEISTGKYPDWQLRSWDIQIVRGEINYSEDDIRLLKTQAAANPDCHELQQFVADSVQGWTEAWQEYYVDRNRKVAVDWNYETPARINKLRICEMSAVTNLDLSGFTELIYLDVTNLNEYSNDQQKHIGLETLDLTKNTKLRELEAQSNYALKTLNTSGLAALEFVSVRNNSRLTGLDLAASKSVLSELHLEGCDLEIDLTQFTVLRSLTLKNTSRYGDCLDKLPKDMESLNCCETEYPLLDFSNYPNLIHYGVPKNIQALDITGTGIWNLELSRSQIRYSALKAGSNVHVGGGSLIPIPNLPESAEFPWREEPVYDIAVGDTVDLSSEATIGGTASRYVWVDHHDWTESTGVFVPVEGEPGKFVYQGGGRRGEFYHCIISNERYCKHSEINGFSGWRLETYQILLPEIQATYAPAEVAALQAIVDGTESPALRRWWESEAWKNGNSTDARFQTSWMPNEETNTYHLEYLKISELGDTLTTLDVSSFTELRGLDCLGNGLTALSLQSNNQLAGFQVHSCPNLASLTLPEEKTNLTLLSCMWNNRIKSLDVSDYTNLQILEIYSCEGLTSVGDLSRLVHLESLWLNHTMLEPLEITAGIYPKLIKLGVPRKTEAIDVSGLERLERLDVDGSMLQYSTVTLQEGKTYAIEGVTNIKTIPGLSQLAPGYADFQPFHLFPSDGTFDLSAELSRFKGTAVSATACKAYAGEAPRTVTVKDKLGDKKNYIIEGGKIHDEVEIRFSNTDYPLWRMELSGQIVSCDGDANLDTKVDVRDVPVTVNHIVQSPDALPEDRFGFYEADMDRNHSVDAADLQGIINRILQPQTKSTPGLQDGYVSAVELSAESGYLYMDAEVPVATLQLELTGMPQAEPLLGKAAGLTQASTAGDTTRILGYSLQGVTIPAGKSVLMKLPEGARLTKAVFSDEKAQRLEVRTKGDIATSNETIRPEAGHRIANYPNPFRRTTTLVYQLDEAADDVCMQVFGFNGALVDIVGGLPAAAGENRFAYSARLGAGTYLYRLVVRKQGKTSYSKSNTFIIK